MAGINLKGIKPHKVSRNMRGYSVFFYGEPKSGKTSVAVKFPNSLLLAFEKGYNTLDGINVQPINKWSEFRQVLIQLEDPDVKETYETIIIDTADIAYDYCEKYICDNNDVDAIGDLGFGKGYGLAGKEFDSALRSISQMGYGVILISHAVDKTFKDEDGKEFNQIIPTLGNKPRNIVARMCDIIGYSRAVETESGLTTKLFMRGTPRYIAGSRFKYTPDYIDFSYQNLVGAIGDAIDEQARQSKNEENFTDDVSNIYEDCNPELAFDDLMKEFGDIIGAIPGSKDGKLATPDGVKFKEYWVPRITEITEKYLGKGKRVMDATRTQTQALELIITDLKNLK